MYKPLLFFFLIMGLQNTFAQSEQNKLWNQVEQLELKGKTRSASELVDKILDKATHEKDGDQIVKAFIYQSKFALLLEEDAQKKILGELEGYIDSSEFPTTSLLQSIHAGFLEQYLDHNRYKIRGRTQTPENPIPSNFEQWDINTLVCQISKRYEASLVDPEGLKRIPIDNHVALLTHSQTSIKYRPTLYDFLMHRALDFHKKEQWDVDRPSERFFLVDPVIFGSTEEFAGEAFETRDSLFSHQRALKLYQALENHHKDLDPAPYIDIVLERLRFSRDNSPLENAEGLYLQALENLYEKYGDLEVSGPIAHEIANSLYRASQKHNAKNDPHLKDNRVKARELCSKTLERFPNSDGGHLCSLLINKIDRKELNLEIEEYVVPDLPFLAKVDHTNIDGLHINVYPLPHTYLQKGTLGKKDSLALWTIKSRSPVAHEFHQLKNRGDHYGSETEINMPALPAGDYLVVATKIKDPLETDQIYAYQKVHVTKLVLLSSQTPEGLSLRILDRWTGNPIEGSTVVISNEKGLVEKGKTGPLGNYNYNPPLKESNQVELTVRKDGDSLPKVKFWLYPGPAPKSEKGEGPRAMMSLFLDRSIYRPGQTLYFKGILTENSRENIKVVPDVWVNLFIYDANGEELQKLRLKTNEYGSVHGEYMIPSKVLTGEFRIEMDEDFGTRPGKYDRYWKKIDDFEPAEVRFSVEEYKRPRFKVEFDPMKENLLVGDSALVKGSAQALMGTPIKDAAVQYTVERGRAFMGYRMPYGHSADIIAQGEIRTDGEGRFDIPFVANADANVPSDQKAQYAFTIKAAVTDSNGETRESKIRIRVGYHNLMAELNIGSILNRDQTNFLKVSTENLNAQPIPARLEIEVFQLQEPEQVFREKPWGVVESPIIEKKLFRELFPHEPYDSTDLKKHWKKGKSVFRTELDTQGEIKVELEGMATWETASYTVVLKAMDRAKDTVTLEKRFDLTDSKGSHLPKSQLFSYRAMNKDIKKDGYVLLQFTTACKGLKVFLDGYWKEYKFYQENLDIGEGVTRIKVPIKEYFKDKISFNLYFVKYNSLYTEQFEVVIPEPSKNLNIETLSFRDRLQPDARESWSFKISNSDHKVAKAEVLASMYDTSLDQFKKHRWEPLRGIGPIYGTYIPGINGHHSFGTLGFRNLQHAYFVHLTGLLKNYHKLDWFGLDFGSPITANNRYLQKLKSKVERPQVVQGNVSGLVTDEQGNPLPGVSILINGSNEGTQTDFNGFYSINAPVGSVLIFSYIGFESGQVYISGSGTFNYILEENSQFLEEVVVAGYGLVHNNSIAEAEFSKAGSLSGKVLGPDIVREDEDLGEEGLVILRGLSTMNPGDRPLLVLDGVLYGPGPGQDLSNVIQPSELVDITVLKDASAIALYGERGRNGVLIVTTKKGLERTLQVEQRTDLKETAFFFPNLTTDRKGEIHINFDSPQALTQWRFMMLAHTKAGEVGLLEKIALTQKDLMVIPNYPRFFREGDTLDLSTKIGNLTSNPQAGTAALQLFDAQTNESLDFVLFDKDKIQNFQIAPSGESTVSWRLAIPEALNAIELKIVAKAGNKSDGEGMVIPVLSNRSLITESKPIWVMPGSTKEVVFDKLLQETSPSMDNHRFSLEYTSNPAWTAIKSLPFLMEFPHDCAEQVFSRYYANAIAQYISRSNPKIEKVFQSWTEADSLVSPLEKNAELRSILLSEAPWALESKNEKNNQAKLGRLFGKEALSEHQRGELDRLREVQHSSGGFPWFSGGLVNPFITRHILAGFGHLKTLNVLEEKDPQIWDLIGGAINYLDKKFLEDHDHLLRIATDSIKDRPRVGDIHFLYARSFFMDRFPMEAKAQRVHSLIMEKLEETWLVEPLYNKGMIALLMHRNGKGKLAQQIVEALGEQAVLSDENGMYWKDNLPGWWWYRAPIETQALMIEAFSEIGSDKVTIDALKLWLMKNKRTHQWPTTKATTEAIYALLLQGSDWLSVEGNTSISVAGQEIPAEKFEATQIEAGTGYFKVDWTADEITKDLATIKIENKADVPGFGGVYWQYFEQLDRVTASEDGDLQVDKTLFLHKKTVDGEELLPLGKTNSLALGDLITIRLTISSKEELEFVHLKDSRASGLEPVDVLSAYKWQDGLGYYQSTKDVATHFFFDRLPKGTHILEYRLRVNNSGDFSTGISRLQSMYAPEFSAHSRGERVRVD